MFKKTLTAVAVLGAFAGSGSAFAADVTLYGVVDLGINYQVTKTDGAKSVDLLRLASGQNYGSRFGLKGSEDLGNGLTVGFQLENGFEADTGALGQGGRLFGREARLYVKGGFGELATGRMGTLNSGSGSYSITYNYAPFGSGLGDMIGTTKGLFGLGDRDRFDNTLTYVTPEFAGTKVYAQYSFQASGAEVAKTNQNKRYAALGTVTNLGAFSTSLVVDTVLNVSGDEMTNTEDSLGISLGASYDFGFMKLYGLGQYGKNENKLAGFTSADFLKKADTDELVKAGANEGFKGYALTLGASAPVCGGNLFGQVMYADAKAEFRLQSLTTAAPATAASVYAEDAYYDGEFDRWGVGVGYVYNLSKRTMVYGLAGYDESKLTKTQFASATAVAGTETETKVKRYEAVVGITHRF